MHKVIEFGHNARTTHSTKSNDTSSRSHAICYVNLKDYNENFMGKLILVDLAVSFLSSYNKRVPKGLKTPSQTTVSVVSKAPKSTPHF